LHQTNADPHAHPIPSFTHVGKSKKILLLLVSALPRFIV
jgi:hypothetical protein